MGRLREQLTQLELSTAIGTTRSKLAQYECGQIEITWSLGLAWARRLDCNLRWLATGAEPQRPYISPEELGANTSMLDEFGGFYSFSKAYDLYVKEGADKWHRENPPDEIVVRQLRGGPAPVMRRLSWKALLAKFREIFETIEKPASDAHLAGAVVNLSAAMDEIKHRVREKHPHLSKLL